MTPRLAFLTIVALLALPGCPGEGDDDDTTAADDDDDTTGADDDDDTTGADDDDDSGLADCVYYRDADEDGYGDPGNEILESCDGPPDGYVDDDQDCDDTDAEIHPDADEACDGIDNDCDGLEDEELPLLNCYTDADGDGYGDPDGPVAIQCECGEGSTTDDTDCDDANAEVHPGGTEICDGRDNDCDGTPNLDEVDADGDGVLLCAGDCDDADATVFPGAVEVCNQIDEDCDGIVDEDTACYDDDGDGFSEIDGDCDDADPSLHPDDADADGWSPCAGDCDDLDPLRNPWAAELCDGLDDDCDGVADDGCVVCTATVPGDFPAIQEAIDAATDWDAICVEPGTYVEDLDFLGLTLSVLGIAGPYATTVQGNSFGSVVSLVSGEGSGALLQGFTVTGGYGRDGELEAGGVTVSGSHPVLARLVIEGNESEGGYGAGLLVDGGAAPVVAEVIVRDNTISAFAAWGGGIYVEASSPVFTDVLVQGNLIEDADYGYGNNVALDMASCTWSDSSIVDGDMYAYGSGVVLERVHIGTEDGESGLEAVGGEITGTNVVFADNDSVGLQIRNAAVTLDGFVFVGNGHPAWDYGSGLHDLGGCTVELTNGVFRGNWSGLIGEGDSSWTLTNVVIDHHDEYGVFMTTGTATFSHCAVWDNAVDFAGIASPVGTDGNVSIDPEFLDASGNNPFAWDLHLAGPSPLVDAGDPGLLDLDGSVSDIGAYGGPNAGGWDLDGDGYFEWWMPGIYDFGVYPGQGWDCDDSDAGTYPGSGC